MERRPPSHEPFYTKVWFWLFVLAAVMTLFRLPELETIQEEHAANTVEEEKVPTEEQEDGNEFGDSLADAPEDPVAEPERPKKQPVHENDVTPIPPHKMQDKAFIQSVRVTKDKYKAFKKGMTYAEIKDIAGTGGKFKYVYEYDGIVSYEFPTVSYVGGVNLKFKDDVLVEMKAYGLDNHALITLPEYDELEDGMTIKEVDQLLGGKGKSYTGQQNDEYKTIVYSYYGARSDKPSSATLVFQHGKLVSKSQTGLD